MVLAGRPSTPGRVLDVGGGAGHLARAVGELAPSAELVVADIAFWKLWLAKRFVAPRCEPVCCDAAAPLPFARGAFALTYCSDALHYVWSRRLLAGEIMRATPPDGSIVLCHLHNALCDNDSPGMPLRPAGYRHLFEERQPALHRERDVLDAVLSGRPIELGAGCPDAELADEPALVLTAGVASGKSPAPAARRRRPQTLRLNPLYTPVDGSRTVRLHFPSAFYAEEFGACRRYLPDEVELPEGWAERCQRGEYDERISELFERHVLLELPEDYL
jgi:SAM-dependent methyltransferase